MSTRKKVYKEKAIAESTETSTDDYTKKALLDIQQYLTEHKSDETLFRILYDKFMKIPNILYYKCDGLICNNWF